MTGGTVRKQIPMNERSNGNQSPPIPLVTADLPASYLVVMIAVVVAVGSSRE